MIAEATFQVASSLKPRNRKVPLLSTWTDKNDIVKKLSILMQVSWRHLDFSCGVGMTRYALLDHNSCLLSVWNTCRLLSRHVRPFSWDHPIQFFPRVHTTIHTSWTDLTETLQLAASLLQTSLKLFLLNHNQGLPKPKQTHENEAMVRLMLGFMVAGFRDIR